MTQELELLHPQFAQQIVREEPIDNPSVGYGFGDRKPISPKNAEQMEAIKYRFGKPLFFLDLNTLKFPENFYAFAVNKDGTVNCRYENRLILQTRRMLGYFAVVMSLFSISHLSFEGWSDDYYYYLAITFASIALFAWSSIPFTKKELAQFCHNYVIDKRNYENRIKRLSIKFANAPTSFLKNIQEIGKKTEKTRSRFEVVIISHLEDVYLEHIEGVNYTIKIDPLLCVLQDNILACYDYYVAHEGRVVAYSEIINQQTKI